MSIHGADRRPWLIISRREGQALLEAVAQVDALTPELRVALEQLRIQLAWIHGAESIDSPSIVSAIEREYAGS